jgi:hypothetical protein
MRASYADILKITARDPQWWDEHGVPRFCDHRPEFCADIYADEVALVLISCQACGREIPVQMSRSSMDHVRESIFREWRMLKKGLPYEPAQPTILADSVRSGAIHYGDPPWHLDDRNEFCHVGGTMNVWDLKVLEFWSRANDRREWQRVPELEIDLPDLGDPERVTGVPHHRCPKCGVLVPDHDGFGVLAHIAPMENPCGYCKHPSVTDGVCGICKAVIEGDDAG